MARDGELLLALDTGGSLMEAVQPDGRPNGQQRVPPERNQPYQKEHELDPISMDRTALARQGERRRETERKLALHLQAYRSAHRPAKGS